MNIDQAIERVQKFKETWLTQETDMKNIQAIDILIACGRMIEGGKKIV